MATISRQQITLTGMTPSYTAANSGGDKCQPGLTTMLLIHNDGAGSDRTVTIDSVRASDQGEDNDLEITVANDATEWVGPLDPTRFAADADGLVAWTYDDHTDVEVAALFF